MGSLVEMDLGSRKGTAYEARGGGPPVLVLHAWWGLTPFFRGLCDRLAVHGFDALAPDLHVGQTASTPEDAERLMMALPPLERLEHARAGLDRLLARHKGERVGVIGFSMGAAYANWLATLRREIAAMVLFYGGAEAEEGFVTATQAAFLGHFAETDEFDPPEAARALEAELRAAGREATFHVYPETGHWFFESDRPAAYDAAAADLAWKRTVPFLRRHLAADP
jgi:carboxymethylenebutenolidase